MTIRVDDVDDVVGGHTHVDASHDGSSVFVVSVTDDDSPENINSQWIQLTPRGAEQLARNLRAAAKEARYNKQRRAAEQ